MAVVNPIHPSFEAKMAPVCWPCTSHMSSRIQQTDFYPPAPSLCTEVKHAKNRKLASFEVSARTAAGPDPRDHDSRFVHCTHGVHQSWVGLARLRLRRCCESALPP